MKRKIDREGKRERNGEMEERAVHHITNDSVNEANGKEHKNCKSKIQSIRWAKNKTTTTTTR